MELKVLAIGDIVAGSGLKMLEKHLRTLRREQQVDFCVVNGENAAGGIGLTPDQAEDLFLAGADVITLGNHAFGKREIVPMLDDSPYLLRPSNLAPQMPGIGCHTYECKGTEIAVLNLIGRCNMDYTPDNPFLEADRVIAKLHTKIIFVDFHAEATSEKLAMGYYLDGRVSCVWGTHTHVPTADLSIFPKGTGYVTDLGMTGPAVSVIGMKPSLSIAKFRGDLPERYAPADGPCKLEGALFTVDAPSGRCLRAERIMLRD